MFISALITVLIFVLGTFALGIIIPQKDINLTQSLLVGFDNYFKFIHASWLSPVIAVALAFGVLAGVLTWVAGPSKGIFAVGKAGYLPPFFQKTNKLGVQKNILLVQGLAVTFLSLLFVVMPSVQSFYQILSQLTVILYLIMYMLMFSGAIALRYRMKKAGRPFRIGKNGNGLMWFIGGLGFCGSLLAFVLSFIPPSQISTGNNTVWFAVLIIGAIVVVAAPFIIYAAKKPSWWIRILRSNRSIGKNNRLHKLQAKPPRLRQLPEQPLRPLQTKALRLPRTMLRQQTTATTAVKLPNIPPKG